MPLASEHYRLAGGALGNFAGRSRFRSPGFASFNWIEFRNQVACPLNSERDLGIAVLAGG
jgi:hypothetical protein